MKVKLTKPSSDAQRQGIVPGDTGFVQSDPDALGNVTVRFQKAGGGTARVTLNASVIERA